jgi:hypothetical protein
MSNKLTAEMIVRGIHFVKTIRIPSEQYGTEPDFLIDIDIKPIKRNDMRSLFAKYNIQEGQDISGDKAIEMMDEVCKLGLVDPTIVSNLDNLGEFLSAKIGTEILNLSTGKGIDLANFSKPKTDSK